MATANFIHIDQTTSGNWPGVYGADGYMIGGVANSFGNGGGTIYGAAPVPSYATLSLAGSTGGIYLELSVIANPSSDPRAPNISPSTGAARIASEYFGAVGPITATVAINDGTTRKVTIFGCDFQNNGGNGTVSVYDHATQTLLDTRTFTNQNTPTYIQWAISGSIDFQIAQGAIISAVFFDPSSIVPTTITLTSSANPAVVGQQVTFTATVTPQTGTVAPTGTVTFYDGATVIGTGTLS